MINITFTTRQYWDLLKLVYLGSWLTEAVRGDEEKTESFEELEQYIYSFAEKASLFEREDLNNVLIPDTRRWNPKRYFS